MKNIINVASINSTTRFTRSSACRQTGSLRATILFIMYRSNLCFVKSRKPVLDNWTIVFAVFRVEGIKSALNCPNSCEFSSFSKGVFLNNEEVFLPLVLFLTFNLSFLRLSSD